MRIVPSFPHIIRGHRLAIDLSQHCAQFLHVVYSTLPVLGPMWCGVVSRLRFQGVLL